MINTYQWNGANQLISLTNTKNETWCYKYDALGRRISKECPQWNIATYYLWDGDQIAFSRTEKNGKLQSERHSIFNQWQLIAQQDYYAELKQTIDGNIEQWQHQTHYAVTQTNGLVLSLFTPDGKTAWRKEKATIWGLNLNEYFKSKPLDPELLFSGQYLDQESGLAYNRFRYYDPETGNYLSSDPIGLQGGETLYFYVQNPVDWVDPFGLRSTAGRSQKLMDIMNDDKQSSYVRGWLKNEYRRISQYKNKFGKQKTMRLPEGYDLAHWRGYESAKGFDYNYSSLNEKGLHRLQHKYDKFGKLNKFKASKKCCLNGV